MEKIKLLICGGLGHIMSNFIRYVLYRSKDFEIVSVDSFDNSQDITKLYIHYNHQFHIGNVCDQNYIEKIISFYRPNIIINSIDSTTLGAPNKILEKTKVITSAAILSSFGIPVIQLINSSDADPFGIWESTKKIIINNGGTALELPNVFGRRQNITDGVAKVVNDIISTNKIYIIDSKLPWVFVEDVASLIWFIIETNLKGHVQMPSLGFETIENIGKMVGNIFNKSPEIISVKREDLWDSVCVNYSAKNIDRWIPDSASLSSSIDKTIKWFMSNKWALMPNKEK
jgi:dTDP-D-glucose 4,6-dehydratase